MFGKKVILLAASILALSLWGCSTDFDAGNNQTSGEAGSAVVDTSSVGAANCVGCHEVLDISNTTTVIADYLAGKHVIHSTHIDATDGDCLKCHDPFGDGRGLESLIAATGGLYDYTLVDPTANESEYLPVAGLAAVTCETCHGGGGDHVNGAAIPYKTPDYNRCGQCHNADFFHRTHGHTAEEDNIVEDYTASKHLSGAIRNSIACVKCHSDEGAKLYKDFDTAAALATALPVAEANSIQCRTCHDPHNNGKLLEVATASGSAEYNTCTNCHQRHDAVIASVITQVAGTSTPDGSSGDLIFHAGSWDRVISSTHWDDPATSYQQALADAGGDTSLVDQTTNIVEGYAIDPLNERACRDCHNVHGADATINKQWASSPHGSHIREAKEAAAALTYTSTIEQVAAIRAAGANGEDNALPHYNWDNSTGNPRTDPDPDRKSCQRCHTATGAKNYLNSLITLNDSDTTNDDIYDPVNNDFSHLDGWAATKTSGQNELIYCWGCHSNNSGELRNPGRVPLEFTVSPSTDPLVLTDLGKSNVCATCHGGRGNNDKIRTGSRSSRFAAHHAPAAGVLLSGDTHLGYEYTDISGVPLDYTNKSYFRHSRIGTDVSADTDAASFAGAIAIVGTDKGPCVSCHMPKANHTFAVVEKDPVLPVLDANDNPVIDAHGNPLMKVTAINNQKLCNACHSTHGLMTPAVIDEQSAGYQNASALLNDYVSNTITNHLNKDLNADSTTLDPDGNLVDEYLANYEVENINYYGAFQNAMFATDEPGGFAHNRYYVKRLIFDSIDWLDNGVLDGIINIDIATYPGAADWFNAADTEDLTAIPPVAVGDATRP